MVIINDQHYYWVLKTKTKGPMGKVFKIRYFPYWLSPSWNHTAKGNHGVGCEGKLIPILIWYPRGYGAVAGAFPKSLSKFTAKPGFTSSLWRSSIVKWYFHATDCGVWLYSMSSVFQEGSSGKQMYFFYSFVFFKNNNNRKFVYFNHYFNKM